MKSQPNFAADLENALQTVDMNKFKHSDVRRIVKLARRVIAAEAEAQRMVKCVEEDALRFARNEEYYRGLLTQIGASIGPIALVQDDGGIVDEPLCAKLPELVQRTCVACDILLDEVRCENPDKDRVERLLKELHSARREAIITRPKGGSPC